ncbi:hypothetical protein [Novosphingobium percolationis]|uniref:hypothetical protein n=1 Tax=Novosphingobium percolationis TaxID=2871811 RepID=UPI001CD8089E|nr:hypothetical protein [Novosphingobium percolationis]
MYRPLALFLTGAVAALSAWQAALAWARTLPPGEVPALLAADPRLRLARMEALLARRDAPADAAAALRTVAVEVLRDDPLNPQALRQMALADMTGQVDGRRGARLLALAARLSRRDLATEYLLIEQAVQADRIDAALAHYDHALTVFPGSREQLFPVLARAIDDEGIRAGLQPFGGRPWFAPFLADAVAQGSDGTALVDVVARARLTPVARTAIVARLLPLLIKRGRIADAGRIARLLDGIDAQALDDAGFSVGTTDPRLAPLNWTLAEGPIVSARIARSGSLAIDVAPEQTGLAAERVMLLAPGAYVVRQKLSFPVGQDPASLRWDVRCLDEREGAKVRPPIWQNLAPVHPVQATYMAQISIPPGCAAQRWRLVASGGASVAQAHLLHFSIVGNPPRKLDEHF